MSPILRGNDGLGARALLTGHVGGCRGSSSARSWRTVCFRPPQHMATVPSQCLINSCHSSHNQYRLISRVCVTLSLHRGSICNPRDRNETARVWKWKPQNYRLEKGANHTFLSPPWSFISIMLLLLMHFTYGTIDGRYPQHLLVWSPLLKLAVGRSVGLVRFVSKPSNKTK